MEVKEKDKKVVDYEVEDNKEPEKNKKRKIGLILGAIIILLLVIIFILCFRVGKIGYNYLSIWDATEIAPIVIKQGDLEITTNTEIGIFSNPKYDGKKIISPMSKGTYKFTITNDTNEDVVYNIKFVDSMNKLVNMKYRLKIDNIYIRGNKNEYISIDDLDVENILSPKDSTNIYTLEWFWENDDENDILVGASSKDEYYTLNLYIYSQAYKKEGSTN